MARFRSRTSRSRSSTSRSWLKSVLRFRRHFPKLLRGDFWRTDSADGLWQSLFRRKKKTEKRRHHRRTGASGWSPMPIGMQPEALEARVLLTGTTYVNDNWIDNSGNFHTGDPVTNTGTGDDGTVTAMFNVNAFKTLTAALASGNVSIGDTVVVLSGAYSDTPTISIQGLTIEGEYVADGRLGASRDTGHGGAIETTVQSSGYQVAANNVTIEGIRFTTSVPAIEIQNGVTGAEIQDNIFIDNSHGVQIDGGGSADLNQNLFTNSRSTFASQIVPSVQGITVQGTGGTTTIEHNTFQYFLDPTAGHNPGGVVVNATGATVSIQADQFSNNSVAINVLGGTANISGNASGAGLDSGNGIYNNNVGIEFSSGGGSVSGNTFQNSTQSATPNGTDLRLSSGAGAVTDGGGNAFYANGTYIDDESSGGLDASGDKFNGSAPPSPSSAANLATLYGLEDKITDGLDIAGNVHGTAGAGLVRIKASDVFLAHSSEVSPQGSAGSIQRAVDLASANDTIYVEAGSFAGNVDVDKSVTLLGAESGVDARARSSVPETIVSDPSVGFSITGPGVRTINGFTITAASGIDPAIQNLLNVYDNIISGASNVGISVAGATHATISGNLITGTGDGIDVSDSAIVATTANSITVGASGIATYGSSTVDIGDGHDADANQIDGQLYGVVLYGGSATIDDNAIGSSGGTGVQLLYSTDPVSATIEHSTISGMGGGVAVIGSGASALIDHNLIQNVGSGSDVSPSVAVLLQDDGYSRVESNSIQNVDIGIEIDTFDAADPNPSPLHTITGNTISYAVDGVVVSNISGAASAFDIEDNAITSEQVPAVVNDGLDAGLMLLSIGIDHGVTLAGNTIDGTETGVFGWNDAALTITGGSITNAHDPSLGLNIGVLLDNFNPLSSHAATNNESFTLSGVQCSNDDTAVEVIDEGDPAAVSAHLTNGTHITGGNYGVYVSGANASATLDDVTIDDPQYGVALYGGSASISNSAIEHNTVGVFVADGGQITSLSGNSITLNGTGVEVGSAGTLGSTTDNSIIANTGDGILIDSNATAVGAISNNNLSGNNTANSGGFALDNLSSLTVDASFNYWKTDAAESDVQGEINGIANVDYTPWLSTAADLANGYGAYQILNVGSGGAPESNRINEAIGGLAAGGLVNVYPGTYVEQVVIGKNLTLEGTDESGVIIQSPASVPAFFTTSCNGLENHPVVYVHNAHVMVESLTVDGNGQGGSGGANANYRFEGVGYYDATGTIDHVTIEHIRETPLSGDQQGVGIFAQNDDAVARSLNITNDTIFDYQKGGIVVNGAGLDTSVANNVVTGIGPTSLIAQDGIQISRGAVASVTGNTVDGNSYTPASTPGDYAAGILLYQAGDGTSVTANTVGATTGSDAGIFLDGTGGNITIGQNTVENSAHAGIYLTDNVGGSTVSENLVENNAAGIVIDAAATNVGAIHDNGIIGNSGGGLVNNSSTSVDAIDNWWGSASGPANPGNTYNVGHQGNRVVGPASFVPWLASGANDAPPGPGFIPHSAATFAPVTVTETGDQFSSIQAAINDPTTLSRDHVVLAAGTFTENVDVTKSLTIVGAGQGLTTVYPATSDPTTGGSLGGSTVFLVDASNVAIEDLTVDGNNPNITSGVTVGGVDIDARTGIITDWNLPNSLTGFTVKNVTVQNICLRGIEYSNGGSGTGTIDIENDTVTNVQGDPSNSIAIFNYAGSGTIAGNTVSYASDAISANHSLGTQFHDNVITHSLSGIHTDNMGDGGGTADAIYDNNISLGGAGSYGIFVFVPYLNVAVHDNVISGVDVGLAAFGGQHGGSANFVNNTVSVNAGGTGAFVTTDTLGYGEMNVAATFTGGSFSGGQTGNFIQQLAGATANATINGVTIDDPTTGIYVIGGHANISNSHIYNNTTGIEIDAGALATLSGNTFDGGSSATDNTEDLKIDSGAGLVTTSGDTYAGNNYFIDNLSTQNIDATTDIFRNVSATDTNFRIEDKMYHKVDDNSLGLITWVTGNLYVTTPGSHSGTTADTDSNIQRGIDAANPGDTVNVEGGTYSRAGAGDTVVNIDKSVTVLATDGPTVTTIDGNSATENYYVVTISASNATLSGFTITNAAYSDTADASGVLVESPTAAALVGDRITSNVIHDIGALTRSSAYATLGINVEEAVDGIELDHNTIYNIGNADPSSFAIGILTAGDPGHEVDGANIHDNIIYAVSHPTFSAGIDAGSSSQNLTIQANTIGSSAAGGSVGYGIRTGSSVSGNVNITANTVVNATVAGIDLNSTFSETVYRNTVYGSGVGLDVENGAVLTSATQNFFGNGSDPIHLTGNTTGVLIANGAASVGPITSDSISGNSHAGLENDSTHNIDADYDWWGSASGPTNAANPGGTGDVIIDPTVTFSPWLTDGTDTQPTTPGFQPNGNAAAGISGPSTGTEAATYTLSLSPSSDISSWDINWGDGTMATPDIQHVDGDPATVTHVFAEEGNVTISAVAHTISSGNVNSNDVNVTVADAALTENSFSPPAATEGAAFAGTVFNFNDTDPNGTASDFTAVVVLGNGNTVTLTSTASADGQIVANGSTFDVNLNHTYLEELAAQTFSVTVTDAGGATVSDTTTHFTVADAALTAGALTPPAATEGAPFTDVQLFHFTDADPNGVAGDYTATITWGDGTTSTVTSTHTAAGQIVGDAAHGFDVLGSHTYLEEATGLNFKVSVTDHSTYSNGFETGDTGTSDWTNDVTGVDGSGITVVTTGSGLLPSAPASGSHYAVVTNTDDGYSSGYGDSGFTRFGGNQKTYTGPFDQSIAIYINTAWAAPAAGYSPAFWLDMAPNHPPGNYGAEHNFRFWVDGSGTIKVTADSDALSNAFATISTSGWYTFEMVFYKAANPSDPALTDMHVIDSTGAVVGSKTALPANSPGGPMPSSDLTGHGYAWLTVWQNGFANDQLAIDNMNTAVLPISASAAINVADADLSGTNSATATGGVEGVTAATLSGATFTDANSGAPSTDFSTSIDWGDSTPLDTSATVSGNAGSYTVNGSHVYGEEGTYHFTITVTDDGGQSTTITGSTTVGDAVLTGSSAATTTGGIEGVTAATLGNATFSDANTGAPSSDFSTSIDWGDNTALDTSATVSGSAGSYTVNGSHLYAEEGTYNFTITVTDDGGQTTTIKGSTTVADAVLTAATGVDITGTEGTSTGVVPVATFRDLGGAEPNAADPGTIANNYSATINWGGAGAGSNAGTIVYNSMTDTFTVEGSFTYTEDGSHTVSVHIVHENGITADTTSTAVVTEPTITGTSATLTAINEGDASAPVTVATFTHANGVEPAADFTAVVDWDIPGHMADPAVVSQPGGPGTNYVVTATRPVYSEAATAYAVTVAISEDGAASLVDDTLAVNEPAINAQSATLASIVEGQASADVEIATFAHANGVEPVGHFSATVDWGQGPVAADAVTQDGGGTYHVTASRPVFAEEGSHPVAVVISDNDSSAVTTSTTDTLLVTEPAISGSVAVLSPVNEGDVSASVTAASFTHAGGVEPATDFTATVDWGIDGHHADSATVAQPGGTGNAYVVTGDRPVYAEEGTYAVSVTISDDGSPTTISGGSITVADAALTAATGVAVSGTEGTSTGTIAVATFRDLGGAEPNAADPGTIADNYSATINWGGAGTGSSTGSIVYNSMTDTFTVQGSFAYAEEGSYTVSAHIVHEGGITADTASTATVGDAALTGSSGATAAGVEGTANSSMLSGATFTDANPGDHSGDFTATITWGDTGPTSLGTVSYDSASQTYTVAGSHTYSEDGSYSISIVVVDDGGSTATITGTATVAEGVLSFTSGTPFSTVEGNDSGTQTVANFSDAGLEPATVYSAVIHWGDGQDSAGSVTQTSPGHFSVTGDHTYAEDNSYNVSVTITDDTVPTTSSTTDTATVTEGGLSFTGGTAFGAVEGNDSGTQTVANFGDAGLEPASAYSAVIHWGDGQDSAGVVTLTSSGHFSVMGSHSYAEENSYNVSVTISDDGVGTTSGTTDTATVTEGGLSFTNGNMFSAMEGFATGTQTVANFSDTGLEPATAYSAMIHWSTGQNTVGVVTQTSPGQFAVTGSTTYAEDGSYNISVTITDDGNHATTAFTDTATVHEGVVSFTNGTPFTSVETSDSGTQIVANFSDTGLEPATGYSATVHWGDGNDSTGTVTQTSPGHFAISGSITYAAHGSYNISVTIDDDNVNTTSGTTDTATVVDRLTVINTNDSGPGSLRQVILYANTLSGPTHTITFAIPAGPQTINLLSPLPATTVPAVMVLDSTQNVVVVSPSPSSRDNFGTLTKTGAGTLTISGANNFGGNVQVDSGLLTLNNSVAPTLTAGITATADGAGTLELAGTVSALSGGANGVNVSNTSMAASGLLVSGTNQVVGGIDGTGNVVVNAGSDLTANHIVQGALVIGGAPGNSATVTIAASDASGNPMAAAAASSDSQATASVATASSDGGTSAAGNAMSMAELLAAIRARRLARQAATITASASAFVSEASASVAAPTVVESSAVAAPSVAESTAVAAPAVIESTDVAASAEAPLATSLKSASVVTLFGFNLDGTVSGSHVSNLAAGTSVSIASGADQSSITDNLHGSIGASGKLDPGAVSAAFDAEDLEWLGSDPFSTAAQPAEAQDPASIDGSLLADDLVEAIGSQWRN